MAPNISVVDREPDLRAALDRGATLPAEWYTDPTVFDLEKARIFQRFWQYVGYSEQLPEPGTFFTCRVGDVPVVVARDLDDTVRAFANVCRHRGSKVVLDECGNRNTLQCHYHGWTWKLDGSLHSAPRSNEQPDFNKEDFPLHTLNLETWGPFIFVNPDRDASALRTMLGELPRTVAATGLDLATLRFRERRTYDIAANWKVLVENFNECYHCPIAHPSFTALVDTDNYAVTTASEYIALHQSTMRPSAKRTPEDRGHDYTGAPSTAITDACYFLLWPTFMVWINPGPANLTVYTLQPITTHRTRAVMDFFFADDVGPDEAREAIAFTHDVQMEDIVLVESVQEGLRSGFFGQGRLMVSRENGIQHFQKLVHRVLTA